MSTYSPVPSYDFVDLRSEDDSAPVVSFSSASARLVRVPIAYPAELPRVDAKLLVDQSLRAHYECYLCLDVVRVAWGFSGDEADGACRHLVCKECIHDQGRLMGNNSMCCQLCKQNKIKATSLSAMVSGQLSSVKVNCRFDGCDAQYDLLMQFRGVYLHESKCDFKPVKCPNSKCDALVPFKDLATHVTECYKTETECDKCGEVVLVSEMEDHLHSDNGAPCQGLLTCPNRCTLRENKYDVQQPANKRHAQMVDNRAVYDPVLHLTQKDVSVHLQTCPRKEVQCKLCGPQAEAAGAYLLKDEEQHMAKMAPKHFQVMLRKIELLEAESRGSGVILGHKFQNSETATETDYFRNIDGNPAWKADFVFEQNGARPRISLSMKRNGGTDGSMGLLRVLNFRASRDDVDALTEQTYAVRIFIAQCVNGLHDLTRPVAWDVHVVQATRLVTAARSWSSLSLEHLGDRPRDGQRNGTLVLDAQDRFCIGVELMW